MRHLGEESVVFLPAVGIVLDVTVALLVDLCLLNLRERGRRELLMDGLDTSAKILR